jgi:polysaccharide export outer membrane protein
MNKHIFYLLLSISVLFTSCIPRFNLPAKKDNSETEMAISAIVAKPYRLQTNDVLSINIKAIDPKLVAIFSTTNEGDPGKSATGLYFDGFTVDDHGNIRMPVLGELNVLVLPWMK